MPWLKCKICTNDFYAKPNWIMRGWGKYCSQKCFHENQKKGKIVACFICQKDTYKAPKDLKHSKSKKYFCSKSCQTKWRNSIVFIGTNHSNWKNGNRVYRNLLERSGGGSGLWCRKCKAKDKRVLIVHHKDSDRENNNLKNLVWLCHNCHYLVHHYKTEQGKFMETLV
jgi:hypothetical protein